ncbi:SH3 domain-containing protein [Brotaphodocola sp.]|uniref:SH3 domain-containing protein n=1 Tax=Brotaphodocola sp. TaxID=3073577 RepID=UPI003D7D3FFD
MKKRRWKRGAAVILGLTLGIYAPVTALQGRYSVYAYTERAASVNATTLNVRSDAGTAYSSIGKLARGASVTVTGEKTGSDGKLWYQIRFAGSGGSTVTGYVLGSYLRLSTSASTSSSTSTPGSTSTSYRTNRSFESQLSEFPESYKAALRQLHAQYPNWNFEAQKTGLDWNTVIENESLLGRNLVHTDSISSFKSTADGAYNWDTSTWNGFDGSSWVAASDDVIRYYMDPRNFLDGTYIFQFLAQEYDASAQTREGLQSMLNGTFMQGAIVSSGSASGSTGVDTSSGNASGGSSDSGNSGGTSYGPGVSGGSSSAPGGQSAVITAPDKRRQNPSSSSESTSSAPAGSSSTPASGTGTSGGPAGSGTSGTTSTGGSNSQAPTSGANGNVRFQGPSASISRHETDRVAAPDVLTAGPGTSAGAATFTAPGSAGPGSSTSGTGTSTGTTTGSTTASTTYADLIMNVAASTGLNPYIIASTILQEQGSDGRGKSISGTYSGYAGYYNYFNIGAYASDGMDAVRRGLWYASQSGAYGRPWNTPEKAIAGGAEYYATNYVKAGQDTLYLKKFNVQGSNIYKHQYMTNVEAAASEGALFGKGYGNTLKNMALTFKIPVYNNMPASPCAKPTGTGSPNNKLRSLGVDGFSLTPTFNRDTMSYDLIVDQSVTSIKVNAATIDSNASAAGAGNVTLSGTSTDIKVIVTAQNGTQRTYTIHVVRQSNGPTYGGNTNGGQNTSQTPSQTPGGSSTGNGTSSSPVVSITPGGSNSGSSTQVTPVIGVAPGQ